MEEKVAISEKFSFAAFVEVLYKTEIFLSCINMYDAYVSRRDQPF
jgi:hypothetical protein